MIYENKTSGTLGGAFIVIFLVIFIIAASPVLFLWCLQVIFPGIVAELTIRTYFATAIIFWGFITPVIRSKGND